MLRELIYLASGLEKRCMDTLRSLVEEGKKEYGDKEDLLEIGREHLKKRKRQIKGLLLNDFREVAEELGLATKKDIEELKEYLKEKRA